MTPQLVLNHMIASKIGCTVAEVGKLGATEYLGWVRFLQWEVGAEQTDDELVQSLRKWSS